MSARISRNLDPDGLVVSGLLVGRAQSRKGAVG